MVAVDVEFHGVSNDTCSGMSAVEVVVPVVKMHS